jgi:hypothetical protein
MNTPTISYNTQTHLKLELLRKSLEEVQKYELLTTTQYLDQMELLLEILLFISARVDPPTELKKTTPARFGPGYD